MRLGACCGPLVEVHGLDGAFERLAAYGYDGVELALWDVSDAMLDVPGERLDDVAGLAADHGLDVIGLYRYFRDDATEYCVTHPDPGVRADTVEYLRRVVEICGRLGGSTLVFGSPTQRRLEGVDPATARSNAAETFGADRLLSALETHGVSICVEPLTWKDQVEVFRTSGEVLEFVRGIDHPNVRAILDGFHLLREADSVGEVPALIEACGPHLGHFHADDASLRGPGAGDLDYGPILSALRQAEYGGYVSVELHSVYVDGEAVEDPAACFERSADYLRQTSNTT